MKVVAVINQKGGVAKTTTTANLGTCLAQMGQRTLLMDMDPQANLTLGLGAESNITHHSLIHALLEPDAVPLAGVIQRIGDLPLYLAPGHVDMARCEVQLTQRTGGIYTLRHTLQQLAARHALDWVLIDCPPSLGALTQNSIIASRYLVVPTQPALYAFAGMGILNKLIADLAQTHKFEVELLGVLMTMVEKGTRLHRTVGGLIRERFGDKVFQTEIYKSVQIAQSEIEGRPITLLNPKSPSAKSYEALAHEVLSRVSNTD